MNPASEIWYWEEAPLKPGDAVAGGALVEEGAELGEDFTGAGELGAGPAGAGVVSAGG